MFSTLSSWVETATQKAKELSETGLELAVQAGIVPELEKGYNVEEEENISGQTASPTATLDDQQRAAVTQSGSSPKKDEPCVAATPSSGNKKSMISVIQFVPPQLRSYSSEWEVFLKGMLAEENTYCLPIRVVLEDTALAMRVRTICGLPEDDLNQIVSDVEAEEVPETLMTEVLAYSSEAEALRFRVVPKYVVEDKFWKNLVVRCRLYYRCPSMSAVLDLMDILHKEPRLTSHDARKHGYGTPCNGAELQKLRDDVGASVIFSQWLEQKRNAARGELQAAASSLSLLQNLVAKKDVSELAESVRESCKYRKTKVSSLLGELQGASSKLVGSALAVDSGDLYMDLLKLNTQLHDAMTSYENLKAHHELKSEDADAGLINSPLSDSASGRKHTTPLTAPAASHSLPLAVNSAGVQDDVAFVADLPWEDEDE